MRIRDRKNWHNEPIIKLNKNDSTGLGKQMTKSKLEGVEEL